MYQLADKLSFIYSDAQCGYVGIGRQAWLRAKWGIPVTVRVCLAAPNVSKKVKKRVIINYEHTFYKRRIYRKKGKSN